MRIIDGDQVAGGEPAGSRRGSSPGGHGGGRRPTSLAFARSARTVAEASRSCGLVAPTFRSPPREPNRDRTIRWRLDGSAAVAVRLEGRPLVAVQADLIEGVLAANRLRGPEAETPRRVLWTALVEQGETSEGSVAA